MKIKTTLSVYGEYCTLDIIWNRTKNKSDLKKAQDFEDKKWIAIDDLISQLQDWNNIEGDNMDLVIKRIEEMIKNGS